MRVALYVLLILSKPAFSGVEEEKQLFGAIRALDVQAAKHLIESGVNVNAKDAEGTPAIVQLLGSLNPIADLAEDDRRGARGDAILRALVGARGIDLNATNAAGETVLIEAIRSLGGRKYVDLLLASGANPNLPGRLWTPLYEAAMRGDIDVANALLARGAHVDDGERVEIRGPKVLPRAPIMIAIPQGEAGIVSVLINARADIDRPDREGWSVRDFIQAAKIWAKDEKLLSIQQLVILEGLRPLLSRVADFAPCNLWDPAQVKAGAFETALAKNIPKKVGWYKSLPIFAGVPGSTISITKGRGGAQNTGIYVISVQRAPKYVLKEEECEKTKVSWIVSQTAVAYPECVLKLKRENDPRLNAFKINDTDDVFQLAPILGVNKMRSSCQLLMEIAPGDRGDVLSHVGTREEYADIGTKISLLHALGAHHGDLKDENFFYERKQRILTLIDYSSLGFKNPDTRFYDIAKRTKVEEVFNMFNTALNRIKEGKNNEWVKSVVLKDAVPDAAAVLMVDKTLEKSRAFIAGYLKALSKPDQEALAQELIKQYRDMQSNTVQSLQTDFGFTEEETAQFFKRYPAVMALAEGKF